MGLGNGAEKTNAREQFCWAWRAWRAAPPNPLQAKQNQQCEQLRLGEPREGSHQMNRRFLATFLASVVSLLASSMLGNALLAQTHEAILALAGRWAGNAILVPASGPNEPYNCVLTYFPTEGGSRLTQNLRCKSANYQFDGTTQLQIAAGKISGRWQDKINNLDGIVNGTVKPNGFDILLSGNFFDAKMTVTTAPCQQSITIIFEEGLPVKKISAVLKKC